MPAAESPIKNIVVEGKTLETLFIPAAMDGQLPAATAATPTLVMLHEGLGCIKMWKDFPDVLAHHFPFNILVYSRYGYGNSTPFQEKRDVDYLHREAHLYLPQVLSAFAIEHPILFGHSDGATIVLLYAAQFPDKPLAAISMAAYIFVEAISLSGIRDARVMWETTKLRDILGRYHQDVDSVFWAWNETWLSPEFRDWSMVSDLHKIKCPLLAVQGEHDEYGSSRQLEVIKQEVPQAEVHLIPNCAHIPHKDQPQVLLALLKSFFENAGLFSS